MGCAFSDKIVYPAYFEANPDSLNAVYRTPNGIYQAHCGLDQVHMSYGHDEVSQDDVEYRLSQLLFSTFTKSPRTTSPRRQRILFVTIPFMLRIVSSSINT